MLIAVDATLYASAVVLLIVGAIRCRRGDVMGGLAIAAGALCVAGANARTLPAMLALIVGDVAVAAVVVTVYLRTDYGLH